MTRPPPAPARAPGRRRHLSGLMALRLADGEAVPAERALHAARCAVCRGEVARFAADAALLARTLALDPHEAAFLTHAALPQRLAALAHRP